jgi:hypothetical protein
LIAIAQPDPSFALSLLERRGGFAWWYIDMVDAAGNGLVLIWSYGLPFLPGYRSSALAGHAPRPDELPSLNVVVYREGKAAFYQLQRYRPEDASYDPLGRRWTMESSTMSMSVIDGVLDVRVVLDASIPASDERLRGVVSVHGSMRQANPSDIAAGAAAHVWTPLAPLAHGSYDLHVGSEQMRGSGTAYVDANVGDAPFCRFGIADWTWARASTPAETRIVYLVNGKRPEDAVYIGAIATPDGAMRTVGLRVRQACARRALYGLRYLDELVLDADDGEFARLRVVRVVDDGPFYLRMLVELSFGGTTAVGWAEFVSPDRIDLARHRALVRMRVDDHTRSASFWLPLFSGSRSGRVRRLLGQFRPARRALVAQPAHASTETEA